MQKSLMLLFFILSFVGTGCATMGSYPGPQAYPAQWDWDLTQSKAEESITEFEKLFYASPDYNEALRNQLAKMLTDIPQNGRLHHMAAVLNKLDGRPDKAWWHWAQAVRDLNWDLTVYGLNRIQRTDLTVQQKQEALNLCGHLLESHPDPNVKAQAANLAGALQFQLGDIPKAKTAFNHLGFIRNWTLLGVFDNDQGKGFYTAFEPERRLDLSREEKGLLGPIKWRPHRINSHSGRLYLSQLMSPSRQALAYLSTWFTSNKAQTVQIRVSTSDAIRIWLNGALVISEEHLFNDNLDNVIVEVPIQKGENHILVKSANQHGAWSFGMRLTDLAGGLKNNLLFRDIPQLQDNTEKAHGTPLRAIGHRLQTPSGTLRDPVVQIGMLLDQGYWKDAVEEAQLLDGASLQSVVAMQKIVEAYLANGEHGKAIDILNRAISQTFNKLPGLLIMRAHFYASRNREDKAQEDLVDALNLQPKGNWLTLELANHFSERGWLVDACHLAEEVIHRAPDYARAHYVLGGCLNQRQYADKAQQSFLRAYNLEKGQISYVRRLYHFFKQKLNYSAAHKYALWEEEAFPHSISPKIKLAVLARIRGERAVAQEWLEKVLAQDPDSTQPYQQLAVLSQEAGQTNEALALFKKALVKDPDNSALADLIEYLEPQGLGWMEALIPLEEEIQQIIATVPKIKMLPGSHYAALLDDEVADVASDGSARRVVTQINMAVTKTGRDQLIQAHMPYAGKTRLLKAYAVQPDGSRQEASSIRGSSIRFRKVEIGTITVVQYVHYALPAQFMPNEYFASWFFQGTSNQVEKSRWVLAIDKQRHLNIKIQGDVNHQTSEQNNKQLHIFSVQKIAPLVPEQFMPPVRDLVKRVSVSTVKDWADYVTWEKALLSTVFRGESRLENLALELTAETKNKPEAFQKLYHFVTQEIRYQQDYENTIAGVKPHACPVVIERGYGDCKDKAVLLILLAKQVGINVHFAILRTTNAGKVEKEVPNQQFNHAIVYVPEQEEFPEGFFMDPTTDGLDIGVLRNDDQGATSLVLDPITGKWAFLEIPYQDAATQWEHYDLTINIEGAKAAKAQMGLTVRGLGAAKIRRVLRSQEQAEKFYAILASHIFPGASLKKAAAKNHMDIVSPLNLQLEADVTPSLMQKNRGWRFQLPNIFPLRQLINLEKRKTPLRIGPPSHMKQKMRIQIPDGHKVTHSPENLNVTHKCFDVQRKVKKTPGEVSIDFHLTRRCVEVTQKEYSDFRTAVLEVVSQMQETVDFERGR